MQDTIAHVDGWPVNIASLPDAVDRLTRAAALGEGYCCFTLNLDHLVKLRASPEFRHAYHSARFITADGEPVANMARREWPVVQRTTGADLLEPLCLAAADANLPVYLFGTSAEVLSTLTAHLQQQCGQRLRIVGCEAPSGKFDPAGVEAQECLDRIERSGARICFVMLGAPKQELFSARAMELGIKCGFLCCGAAGDFLVGSQQRAPQILQHAGLEWAWRLARHPLRLGMRYVRCLALYFDLQMRQRLRRVSKITNAS